VIDRGDATGNNIEKVCIRLKNIAGYKIEGIEHEQIWKDEVQTIYEEAMRDGILQKGDWAYANMEPFQYYLNHGGHNATHIYDADTSDAEGQTLDFLADLVSSGASPMCGNSICQDRRFLAREMPELEAFFHYRNLDVSSLKILAAMWAPAVAAGLSKASSHLAMDDIRDSIAELRHYRDHFLITEPGGCSGMSCVCQLTGLRCA